MDRLKNINKKWLAAVAVGVLVVVIIAGWLIQKDKPIVIDESKHNTFVEVGNLVKKRAEHSTVLLPNGKVLITGGSFGNSNNAELFDPSTNRSKYIGKMTGHYINHKSILLPNNKVLLVGDKLAEIYDPEKNKFTTSIERLFPSIDYDAVLLPNGNVLVTGGSQKQNDKWVISRKTEIFDINKNKFIEGNDMIFPRSGHKSILLNNGKVLIVGTDENKFRKKAEIYNPKAEKFILIKELNNGVVNFHTLTLLPSGKVLIVQGKMAEVYHPENEKFSIIGGANIGRTNYTTTSLNSGKILVVGSTGRSKEPNIAELYHPQLQQFTRIRSRLNKERYHSEATLLQDGKVLITGGRHWDAQRSMELYIP